MSNHYFTVERPGIHTTFQDSGYEYLQHFGITTGGVVDNNLFKIANKLLGNNLNETIIEFAYQGPLLKLKNGMINFAITGDVAFNIVRKNSLVEEGKCYQNYILESDDQLDIISTKKSVYGYLSVSGGFKFEKTWNSFYTDINLGNNSK